MFAYTFTNLGAFAIAVARGAQGRRRRFARRLQGAGQALSVDRPSRMAFFMLSLTGIPPTGGFAAKFYVFSSAVQAGLIWLVLIGVVTSVISAYYYLRVVFLMYMYDGEREMTLKPGAHLGRGHRRRGQPLLLGLLPGAWFDLAQQADHSSVHATLAAGG
jgi:NADH-quinone oxidoreductase subunit N